MVIMFVGAVNFALMFRVARGRTLRPLLWTAEFRFYGSVLAAAVVFITAVLVVNDGMALSSALRGASFDVGHPPSSDRHAGTSCGRRVRGRSSSDRDHEAPTTGKGEVAREDTSAEAQREGRSDNAG